MWRNVLPGCVIIPRRAGNLPAGGVVVRYSAFGEDARRVGWAAVRVRLPAVIRSTCQPPQKVDAVRCVGVEELKLTLWRFRLTIGQPGGRRCRRWESSLQESAATAASAMSCLHFCQLGARRCVAPRRCWRRCREFFQRGAVIVTRQTTSGCRTARGRNPVWRGWASGAAFHRFRVRAISGLLPWAASYP